MIFDIIVLISIPLTQGSMRNLLKNPLMVSKAQCLQKQLARQIWKVGVAFEKARVQYRRFDTP